MQCLTVTIHRGKDGYGFTICSDSPVRVQAVDPGPADQAGLQQLDTLLQLNGQPVEQWKCVDLAHAINSASEITLVVWRTGPSAKPNFEGLIHRPTYKSSTSNYDAPSPPTRRRDASASKTPPAVPPLPAHHRATAARRLLINGSDGGNSGALGMGTLAWGAQGGSSEELDGKPRLLHHPTATLKGTRVKASNGDNYIILSPITSGGQGRLYPTRQTPGPASQSQSGGGFSGGGTTSGGGFTSRTGFLRRSNNSKTTKTASTSTNSAHYQQPSANFANYQNCTIVRSHTPHGNYGYVKVAPKILIFPIFVQPIDLCSRNLIISEEMILHESKHHALKPQVTVFVYNDLMLVTREDEPGRCNVLQSPLYLRHLRLQDLRFYLIHMTEKCDCLLSLEAYSSDQKRRVCQCLKDNIDKQL
uniref:PDZ domain-containing protein n=1 Tax=Periophthalmus magnuspinnatus TaxID=409849 RepID=A0A3B4B2T9_9GOBI